MISRSEATQHISKYRQVQSDLNRILSDLEEYLTNEDTIIYCCDSPHNAHYYVEEATRSLEATIKNLSNEEDLEDD